MVLPVGIYGGGGVSTHEVLLSSKQPVKHVNQGHFYD